MPRGPPRRVIFSGSLHFPSRREPFAWQINDDSVFLKGRAELIISPITWSGLVEIYSYHLPRTLKILRVMKGPPPGCRRAPAAQPGAGGREGSPTWRAGGKRSLPRVPIYCTVLKRARLWTRFLLVPARDSIHTTVLMYWWAQEEPLTRRRAEDNHKMCLNI